MNESPELWRSLVFGCLTGTFIGLLARYIINRLSKKGGQP